MAIVKKWTCDGCGTGRETSMEAAACGDFMDIKVTAGSWGKQVLLCQRCHDRLIENIDPDKWSRAATPDAPRPLRHVG